MAAAFEPWWDYARTHYLDLTAEAAPTMTTMYYDPVVDVHHRVPVAGAVTTAFYASPMMPVDGRRLYDAASSSFGADGGPLSLPLRPSRAWASALALSREWGLTDIEARLVEAIEASFEPTWDRDRGEFTWGMGLDEEHPRGQYNAYLAAAEATAVGAWARVSAAPLEPGPRVVDVDFPDVALSEARWEDGALALTLAPLAPDPRRRTSFRITGLPAASAWAVDAPDGASDAIELESVSETPGDVTVTAPIDAHSLRVRPAGA